MATVLIVEDDQAVGAALEVSLRRCGHSVVTKEDALSGLRQVVKRHLDVVVLDLGLPDVGGEMFLRMLRGISDVPVIAAAAQADEHLFARVLDAGADDCVVKPYSAEQITARVASVLRRHGSETFLTTVTIGDLMINLAARMVILDGESIELSPREFDLLEYLARRRGRVVSRRELIAEVWKQPCLGDDQTIDVHMSWLRKKLGESARLPRFLHTVRGVGVKLELFD